MLKILIVEDEEAISDLIRMHLTRAGYVCEQAFDGKEGADKICSKHYDLVLLDIMLPEISGYELLDYVKEKHENYIHDRGNVNLDCAYSYIVCLAVMYSLLQLAANPA